MTPVRVVLKSISFAYLLQHYVQAPEARPVPDGRAPSGLQQQSSQPPQQREKQQQQQQQELCHSTQIGRTSLQKSLNPQQQKQTQTQSRKMAMASGVDIPYDISWVFPRLRNPSTLWYVTSQIVITLVGILSKIILGELASNLDLYRSLYIVSTLRIIMCLCGFIYLMFIFGAFLL